MKCARKDCFRDAIWYPLIVLAHESAPAITVPSIVELPRCDECKGETTLEDLVTDDSWRYLDMAFLNAGKLPPTRSLTALDWMPIELHEQMMRARKSAIDSGE